MKNKNDATRNPYKEFFSFITLYLKVDKKTLAAENIGFYKNSLVFKFLKT